MEWMEEFYVTRALHSVHDERLSEQHAPGSRCPRARQQRLFAAAGAAPLQGFGLSKDVLFLSTLRRRERVGVVHWSVACYECFYYFTNRYCIFCFTRSSCVEIVYVVSLTFYRCVWQPIVRAAQCGLTKWRRVRLSESGPSGMTDFSYHRLFVP